MAGLAAQAPFSSSTVLSNLTETCISSSIPTPSLFGAEILNVTSSLVTNYTASFLPPMFFNSDPPLYDIVSDLTFCNVTVTYTHPGQNDNINVNVWLPLSVSEGQVPENEVQEQHKTNPSWNGILLSHGGGGFSTCLPDIVSHTALIQGYATSRTDGGHAPISLNPAIDIPPTESWAMLSPGNVNLYLFQDFASVALHDLSILSKQIVHSFYASPPKYSYFQGCSTGGRQGLMLAQRYPTAYDGILSGAPAIYFPQLVTAHWFGQMMMHALDSYPKPCELEALTRAAIRHCDGLDGVIDGIISNEAACDFDPFPFSNPSLRDPISCTMQYADQDHPTTHMVNISMQAAHVAYHLWGGAKGSVRRPNWHVVTHSAPLTQLAGTKCFRENDTCEAAPNPLAVDWIKLFLYKDPSLSVEDLLHRITLDELERLFHQGAQEYDSLIGTADPDLSRFAQAGAKLLLWHGDADEAIFPGQSTAYYKSVLSTMSSHSSSTTQNQPQPSSSNVTDFLRFFVAPGIQHCGTGDGVLPVNALQALRAWVEHGSPPETLQGESFGRADGVKIHRRLCLFPKVARFRGRGGDEESGEGGQGKQWDWGKEESFECADEF